MAFPLARLVAEQEKNLLSSCWSNKAAALAIWECKVCLPVGVIIGVFLFRASDVFLFGVIDFKW